MHQKQRQHWQRAAAKARRLNRERDQAAPLFAGQDHTTPAEQYWHTRRRIVFVTVHGSEFAGARLLDWLEVKRRERQAAELLGAEELAQAQDKARRLYDRRAGVEYHLDHWHHALKGRLPDEAPAPAPYQPDDGGARAALDLALSRIHQEP